MLTIRPRHLDSSFTSFTLKLQSFITYNLGENTVNDLSVKLELRVVFLRSAFPYNKKPKSDNEQSFRVSGINFITFKWISFYLKGHSQAVQKQGHTSLLRVNETAF